MQQTRDEISVVYPFTYEDAAQRFLLETSEKGFAGKIVRGPILTKPEAIDILMDAPGEHEDPAETQFRSGADVCESLAAHFALDADDYREHFGWDNVESLADKIEGLVPELELRHDEAVEVAVWLLTKVDGRERRDYWPYLSLAVEFAAAEIRENH